MRTSDPRRPLNVFLVFHRFNQMRTLSAPPPPPSFLRTWQTSLSPAPPACHRTTRTGEGAWPIGFYKLTGSVLWSSEIRGFLRDSDHLQTVATDRHHIQQRQPATGNQLLTNQTPAEPLQSPASGMTSPGLLLLLLVSSSFFLSSVCLEVTKEQVIDLTWKTLEFMKEEVVPFLELIPIKGEWIAKIASLALGIPLKAKNDKEVLEEVKFGFENLNSKIDEYHNEQKVTTWRAATHKTELDIRVAWSEYENLLKSLEGKSKDQKKKLTEDFTKDYKKLATKELYAYLTTERVSLIGKLGEVIKGSVKCHEEELREYAVLINTLIYKGITMNHFYYQINDLTDSNRVEESAKIAYESASVMFEIQKACILNTAYIEEEVRNLIESNKKRAELAHTIRDFLAKTHKQYDWMVVAYLARHSNYPFKLFNKHTLTGFFLKVRKNKVEVAIARQVKGKNTKADKVREAIKRCKTEEIDCHQVAEKLTQCAEKADNINVNLTYTALHAYIDEPHQSVDAKEAPAEVLVSPADNTVPYMITGTCKKYKVDVKINKGGHFTVLIKSDEEMMKQDPCSGLNCGKNGTCVRVEGSNVAMCECEKWFYGKNCEHNIEEFKKELMKKD